MGVGGARQAGEDGEPVMPSGHPSRAVHSSSGYRHLEAMAEVSAGKVNLGSVSKGMALKVTEQDELNHRMMTK